MKLRKYVEKNNVILWIYLKVRCYIFLISKYPLIKLKGFFRKIGVDSSFDYVKQFHNIHEGERCFIVATGPSLTKEDLNKLKSEYTFGVNALCLLFNELKWNTNYFVISDAKAYLKLNTQLPKKSTKNIFISALERKDINDAYTFLPRNVTNYFLTSPKYKKFSNDIRIWIYDATTVVFNAIQIATYMGFKEIYLIGVDCNYNVADDLKYSVDHGIRNPYYKSAGIKMIEDFNVAKRYTDKLGVKVYNATRGGMLEVFERVDLDEVIINNK